MVYRTLGKNRTGQQLVGCPHINPLLDIQMSPVYNGTLFEVTMMGHHIFLPSERTIAVWCPDCYTRLVQPEDAPLTKSESR